MYEDYYCEVYPNDLQSDLIFLSVTASLSSCKQTASYYHINLYSYLMGNNLVLI